MYALMDVLTQLMPRWNLVERRDHLSAFRDRDRLESFLLVYIPDANVENPRRIANVEMADAKCVTDLICSLPGNPSHLIEQARAFQRHCGLEPSSDLVCRPLSPIQWTQELAHRVQRIHPQQPRQQARSSQEVCASVVATLPVQTVTSKGQLFQYNDHGIHTLVDDSASLWFRGIAVAEVIGYEDSKDALKRHVPPDRKQKRERLPMDTPAMMKKEREAIWINVQGVRDLVEGKSNDRSERFWQWFNDTVLHRNRSQEPPVTIAPRGPQLATLEEITVENIASTRLDRQRANLDRLVSILRLAKTAHDFSQELGLTLPEDLRADHLMRVVTLQGLEPQRNLSEAEMNRITWSSKQQDEMNARMLKKSHRLEIALEARRLTNVCGLRPSPAQLLAERQALECAATPNFLDEDGWITAGDYLRYTRGHPEEEVQQLQTSFGRSLKLYHTHQRGQEPETVEREYHQNQVRTGIYHAFRDRALLNAAYQAFALTDLYREVVPPAAQAINNM
jgi:prophage antirepressor-like protein